MWEALQAERVKPIQRKAKEFLKGAESPLQEEARLVYLEQKAKSRVTSLQRFYRSLKKRDHSQLVVNQEPEIPVKAIVRERTIDVRRQSVIERLEKFKQDHAKKLEEIIKVDKKKEQQLQNNMADEEEIRRHHIKQAERKRKKAFMRALKASQEKEKESYLDYVDLIKHTRNRDGHDGYSRSIDRDLEDNMERYQPKFLYKHERYALEQAQAQLKL